MFDIIFLSVLCVVAFRLLRFATTPLLKKIGFYRYYSPMFMTMPWFFNTYDLHLGTSWDFVNRSEKNPQKVMECIAEGLINIAVEIQEGAIKKNASFKGNTFYFKEETVKRFGFKTRRMNYLEGVLFILNYTELCILNSIAKKKLYFVPFKNVTIVTCTAEDILQNKNKFEHALRILKDRGTNRRSGSKIKSIREPVSMQQAKSNENRKHLVKETAGNFFDFV